MFKHFGTFDGHVRGIAEIYSNDEHVKNEVMKQIYKCLEKADEEKGTHIIQLVNGADVDAVAVALVK